MAKGTTASTPTKRKRFKLTSNSHGGRVGNTLGKGYKLIGSFPEKQQTDGRTRRKGVNARFR